MMLSHAISCAVPAAQSMMIRKLQAQKKGNSTLDIYQRTLREDAETNSPTKGKKLGATKLTWIRRIVSHPSKRVPCPPASNGV